MPSDAAESESSISTFTVVGAVVIGAIVLFVIRKMLQVSKAGAGSSSSTAAGAPAAVSSSAAASSSSSASEYFLDRTRKKVPLAKKEQLSPDTFKFRFSLPEETPVLGLPVGKHFKVYAPNTAGVDAGKWNGRDDREASKEEVTRSYTPVSSDDDRGFFELVIKVYQPNDRFSDGGKVSQYINSLKIGDELEISGPYGLLEYPEKNKILFRRKPLIRKKIGMVAGGTGITPMLQIINAVLKNPDDDTELWLLFANQTEEDILVRDELERNERQFPDRFHLWYTLDRPPAGWTYSQGFVTPDMIKEHLPAPAADTAILMCGPPPMVNSCANHLETLGYDKNDALAF